MAFEKAAELDGREVWLATLSRPEDAAAWAGTARQDCGVLLFLEPDDWDADQLDRFVEEVLKYAPSEVAIAGDSAHDARAAFEQEQRLHPRPRTTMVTAREDEELDESVWYMFYATIDGVKAGDLKQPPLIVAFVEGDPRAAAFKSIAARFGAAMNEVLERD
ncbi:MAG: hypothetical protein HY079_10435 [Elusimicrobia bacterium]|nr:hypothetical protein [Elusimicrobiota bacterium]